MLSLYPAFPDDFDPAATPLMVTIDGLEVPLWCDRFERRGHLGGYRHLRRFRYRTPRRGGCWGSNSASRSPTMRMMTNSISKTSSDSPWWPKRPEPTKKAPGPSRTTTTATQTPSSNWRSQPPRPGPRRRGVHRTHRFRGPHDPSRPAPGSLNARIAWLA